GPCPRSRDGARNRARRVYGRTAGDGDPAATGPLLRRTVRRQLGDPDLVPQRDDSPVGYRRALGRRRRRTVRRLRTLPGGTSGRVARSERAAATIGGRGILATLAERTQPAESAPALPSLRRG